MAAPRLVNFVLSEQKIDEIEASIKKIEEEKPYDETLLNHLATANNWERSEKPMLSPGFTATLDLTDEYKASDPSFSLDEFKADLDKVTETTKMYVPLKIKNSGSDYLIGLVIDITVDSGTNKKTFNITSLDSKVKVPDEIKQKIETVTNFEKVDIQQVSSPLFNTKGEALNTMYLLEQAAAHPEAKFNNLEAKMKANLPDGDAFKSDLKNSRLRDLDSLKKYLKIAAAKDFLTTRYSTPYDAAEIDFSDRSFTAPPSKTQEQKFLIYETALKLGFKPDKIKNADDIKALYNDRKSLKEARTVIFEKIGDQFKPEHQKALESAVTSLTETAKLKFETAASETIEADKTEIAKIEKAIKNYKEAKENYELAFEDQKRLLAYATKLFNDADEKLKTESKAGSGTEAKSESAGDISSFNAAKESRQKAQELKSKYTQTNTDLQQKITECGSKVTTLESKLTTPDKTIEDALKKLKEYIPDPQAVINEFDTLKTAKHIGNFEKKFNELRIQLELLAEEMAKIDSDKGNIAQQNEIAKYRALAESKLQRHYGSDIDSIPENDDIQSHSFFTDPGGPTPRIATGTALRVTSTGPNESLQRIIEPGKKELIKVPIGSIGHGVMVKSKPKGAASKIDFHLPKEMSVIDKFLETAENEFTKKSLKFDKEKLRVLFTRYLQAQQDMQKGITKESLKAFFLQESNRASLNTGWFKRNSSLADSIADELFKTYADKFLPKIANGIHPHILEAAVKLVETAKANNMQPLKLFAVPGCRLDREMVKAVVCYAHKIGFPVNQNLFRITPDEIAKTVEVLNTQERVNKASLQESYAKKASLDPETTVVKTHEISPDLSVDEGPLATLSRRT